MHYYANWRNWKMNEEKTIKNIKNFCTAYSKQANGRLKEEYFNSQVKLITTYVPYSMKMAYVKNVVDATSFNKIINEDGTVIAGNRYERDGSMQFLLYTMMLIDRYTNITIDYGNNDYPLTEQYDDLKKNGLIDKLYAIIPESETGEFKILLSMYNDDVYTNYATPEAFWSGLIDRFGNIASTLLSPSLEKLGEIINNMDENKISSILEKIK